MAAIDDMFDTLEEVFGKAEELRKGLGYNPPKPLDDDPRWDKNEEHCRDNEIREREGA